MSPLARACQPRTRMPAGQIPGRHARAGARPHALPTRQLRAPAVGTVVTRTHVLPYDRTPLILSVTPVPTKVSPPVPSAVSPNSGWRPDSPRSCC